MVYNDYMANLGNMVPESIDQSAKNIQDFRDGLEYSFVNYVQSLGKFFNNQRLH